MYINDEIKQCKQNMPHHFKLSNNFIPVDGTCLKLSQLNEPGKYLEPAVVTANKIN